MLIIDVLLPEGGPVRLEASISDLQVRTWGGAGQPSAAGSVQQLAMVRPSSGAERAPPCCSADAGAVRRARADGGAAAAAAGDGGAAAGGGAQHGGPAGHRGSACRLMAGLCCDSEHSSMQVLTVTYSVRYQ